ncbi:MAG TPA: sigma-54 dependent transcriptional regulator [bacterium]|nr:sigma-54 dependent transcriptional regulator [bacterium]HQL62568.1 sigma-54 dependent transcriptional regulator [bacterium]
MTGEFQEERSKYRILIVDDDGGQRSLLASFLSGQGFTVLTAASGEESIEILNREEDIHIIISDVRMPGMSGLDTLRLARKRFPTLPVLLVTAYADIRDAVRAMQDGAVNYLEKPIDLDELLSSVQKAIGICESAPLQGLERPDLPEDVIAESPLTLQIFREAAFVAPSDSRILITGESGVGKEVLADFIHRRSGRVSKPLVKVNCATIPEALLESELFGHERGSFTGASQQRIGRFEEADGGSILLDEIGEMSPPLQAKLLQITQDGTFQRVGSNLVRKTNVRILATTNRNLEKEVEQGKFREDLFFRLNVMEIYVPPLRERREDIIPLANYFAAAFMDGRPRLSPSVVRCLEEYEWPGNVRELRNAMERATLMARGDLIIREHLPKRILAAFSEDNADDNLPANRRKLEDIEREAILKTLRKNAFNRSGTARELGISRRALLYKIQRYTKQGYEIN